MTYVDLSGAFGYGTKLTSTQMQNLRDNLTAMAAGDSGAPKVAQAGLKTATGDINSAATSTTHHVRPGGQYGFLGQIMRPGNAENVSMHMLLGYDVAVEFESIVAMSGTNGNWYYTQWRYVTSSGEIYWIFYLRDKITKKLKHFWHAPDHPCFGNSGKPLLVPHPWRNFDPVTEEIIVVTLDKAELQNLYQKCKINDETRADKSLSAVLYEEYEIDETSTPQWPDTEVTVGLPPDWDEAWISGKPIQPIKKVIPKPDYVLCRSLKLKAGK